MASSGTPVLSKESCNDVDNDVQTGIKGDSFFKGHCVFQNVLGQHSGFD